MGAAPTVVDWNNDGLVDILAGDVPGNVTVFLNTNNNTNPIMDNGSIILAGGSKLATGRATPEVNDWNEDGKKDLLIGDVTGKIKIYINEGTDAAPVFNTSTHLHVGGIELDIGSRAAPKIIDWNKDGLKDLLVGEIMGNVYLLENVGTNNSPVFDTADQLILTTGAPLNYDVYSRLNVTDWNNDGLIDILVGGEKGSVMLFEALP